MFRTSGTSAEWDPMCDSWCCSSSGYDEGENPVVACTSLKLHPWVYLIQADDGLVRHEVLYLIVSFTVYL